ncbi:hypothetical protein PMAYCL1PPCAC_24719, partial [Pristionchus mayeri]
FRSSKSPKDHVLKERITEGLAYNAFFYRNLNAVFLLAPSFFPLMRENSSETTMLGYGALIAHEIFHSFITPDLATGSPVFRRERDCIDDHFKESCRRWAEGSCHSGLQTVYEDAPDLEG